MKNNQQIGNRNNLPPPAICPKCGLRYDPRRQECPRCGAPNDMYHHAQSTTNDQPWSQQYDGDQVHNRRKNKLTLQTIISIVTLLAAIVFFVLWITKPAKDNANKKVLQLESQNLELKQELDELKKNLAGSKSEIQENRQTNAEKPKDNEKKEYSLGEDWIVDGQWSLRVDSVTVTNDRNQFSEKNPEQVVIIHYTYKNLGYESDIQDLYFTPDSVIDEKGKMASSYPASISVHPQPTPIGAICEGAEDAFGLSNESSQIKVMFEKYDNNSTKQKATFIVPVE